MESEVLGRLALRKWKQT